MLLPLNVGDLLSGKAVEWERLEFKAGWNPLATLHTLCAFANDFHNLGGGYLLVGVAEKSGQPVLPPAGLPPERIDAIQKELLGMGNSSIQPSYHPIVVPHEIAGRQILIIWAPGGQTRPYKAKLALGKIARDFGYFIRKGSSTVRAKGADERELLSLAATVPFDDRINQQARVQDLSAELMREFLQTVGSDLVPRAARMTEVELGRQLNVIGGSVEAQFPLNVGLLFFNPEPYRFFPATQIDVVWFPDGPGGDKFTEKIFRGPLPRMLRESLDYIRRNHISQTVIKHADRAEATRVDNYPFDAIEEAVVNAVYHRGYDVREPVEVRITPEELVVTSYPGPDRSIRLDQLRAGKAIPRRYRNRRIGEFLKELEFTEGRSTGIPKILRAMKRNGSPAAEFEFDEDHSYFQVRLRVHPQAAALLADQIASQVEAHDGAHDEAHDEAHDLLSDAERDLLVACADQPRGTPELLSKMGYTARTGNFKRALARLLSDGFMEMTLPDRPRSKNQQYRLATKGRAWLAARRKREVLR